MRTQNPKELLPLFEQIEVSDNEDEMISLARNFQEDLWRNIVYTVRSSYKIW